MHLYPFINLSALIALDTHPGFNLTYKTSTSYWLCYNSNHISFIHVPISIDHHRHWNQYRSPQKLLRRQQTVHIWLITPVMLRGTVVSNIWKHLTRRMALSTCTRKRAMDWVSDTSDLSNWPLLEVRNGGITSPAPTSLRISFTTKPLSTMTWSSGPSKSSKPDFLNKALSDTEPANSVDTNVTAPDGIMPTMPLNVVVPL